MGITRGQPDNQDEELKRFRESKPRLYTYPNTKEFATVFEFEDLAEESLVCLCVKPKRKQYIWSGIDFNKEESEVSKFANEVKKSCWGDDSEGILQNYLTQESPSDSFLEYFD